MEIEIENLKDIIFDGKSHIKDGLVMVFTKLTQIHFYLV
jgi:hypothetical protein